MLEFCKSVLEFAKPKHSIFDFCMPSSIFFARYSGFFEHDNSSTPLRAGQGGYKKNSLLRALLL